MDKARALDQFWNSFSIPAYDETTVPEDVADRHITYNFLSDALENEVNLHATMWDRTNSWTELTQKVMEIEQTIEHMEHPIPLDKGYMWIYRGHPFAQRIEDDINKGVHGYYMNITVEYLTEY